MCYRRTISRRFVNCLLLTAFLAFLFFASSNFISLNFQTDRTSQQCNNTKHSTLSSLDTSAVLYYDRTKHFVKNGRVFLKDDAKTYGLSPDRTAQDGFEYMRTLTVAIAGTCRNCLRTLKMMRSRLESLARSFHDYKFLILENDSTDDSRGYLLQWAKSSDGKLEVLGCGEINLRKCHIPFASGSHVPGGKHENADFEKRRRRVEIMAELRNIYVKRIVESAHPSFNFMIVIDFDLYGSFTPAGVARSFLHFRIGSPPFVDAVCANARGSSLTYFWDACTIVFPPMSKWEPFEQPWEFVLYKNAISNVIPRRPGIWRPQKVVSCFQGFAIYRVSTIKRKNVRYQGPPKGYHTCEHNMFAYQLDNVYVEPSFDLHVTINSSE